MLVLSSKRILIKCVTERFDEKALPDKDSSNIIGTTLGIEALYKNLCSVIDYGGDFIVHLSILITGNTVSLNRQDSNVLPGSDSEVR